MRFQKGIFLIGLGFALLALALAGLQCIALRQAPLGPDSIEYLEIADQIKKIGYSQAQSGHWSPLYSIYIFAGKTVWGWDLQDELSVSIRSFAVLLFSAFGVALLFLGSIGRLLMEYGQAEKAEMRAWAVYGMGLGIYLLFVLHQVVLRLPDTLVFCFVLLALWAWCRTLLIGFSWEWGFLAGLFSGLGFLARSSVLPWSIVTAIIAVSVYPQISLQKRGKMFLFFLFGLLTIFGPQLFLISGGKGHLTFGESGKNSFASVYGVEWKEGGRRWPVQIAGGDVRIFGEKRSVNFPGFYEPQKEWDNGVIIFKLSAAFRGLASAIQSLLFGYYSPRWSLIWPILWGIWPVFLFGIQKWPRGREEVAGEIIPNHSKVRRSVAWLLVLSGTVGIEMHLFSFLVGYYLAGYLFVFLCGLSILVLEKSSKKNGYEFVNRSFEVVAAGFVVVATLATISLFRDANLRSLKESHFRTKELAEALLQIPNSEEDLRRIAVGGFGWQGLYPVRLSKSQVYADIPDLQVFNDPVRLERTIAVLREHKVIAILAPIGAITNPCELNWICLKNAGWYLLNLREKNKGNAVRSR